MRKLRQININNIMFLDIETAPQWLTLADAPENVRNEWVYKFKFRPDAPQPYTYTEGDTPQNKIDHIEMAFKYYADLWTKEAGFYPEFSRIVCISFGMMYGENLRVKSFSDEREANILISFISVLNDIWAVNKGLILCAHNGKDFDFPFMIKRMLFHRLEIPMVLDTYGLKPWEMLTLLDTLEIWKMGGRQGGGLPAIAMLFGIPTPKDDIDGSQVAALFHKGEVLRIVVYCEKDVVTLCNVLKGMRCEELLKEGQVINVM